MTEQHKTVRLLTVKTPWDSGLLGVLLEDFTDRSGYDVRVQTGDETLYDLARAGEADVVISHYGHKGVRSFMDEGFGDWPTTVFANQHALVGPPSDPANVRGGRDLAEAFRRIAATGAPYVVNNDQGLLYVEEIVWSRRDRPHKGNWYRDDGLKGVAAMVAAAERGAYSLWGITPFLQHDGQDFAGLEPLVLEDPLLQRLMVSIVVKSAKVPGVDADGALALQRHLVAPDIQARIIDFRVPGIDAQLWWPAGRHNAPTDVGGLHKGRAAHATPAASPVR